MKIKNKNLIKITCILLIINVIWFVSCSESENVTNDGFDRGMLLNDMASELIIPNFEQLQQNVNVLSVAIQNFTNEATETNLLDVREAWISAAKSYQECSAFGFGPGTLPLGPFATVIGVFPVNENQVEVNISDTSFDLSTSFSRDIRGFYTIEYLIYGNNASNLEILNGFNVDRKAYLRLIIEEVKSIVDGIVTEWNTSYIDEFTSNTGTSAGSPISLLYNEFVKDYENLKNFKVELPAGLTAGQSNADPTLVEAYYSGISLDLIQAHFNNSKNIWSGTSSSGEDIVGFEEYLEEVVGGEDLIVNTIASLSEIENAIAAIPDGALSENVSSEEVAILRNLLQSNTANFKSSLSSLIGISITFNSGDGD